MRTPTASAMIKNSFILHHFHLLLQTTGEVAAAAVADGGGGGVYGWMDSRAAVVEQQRVHESRRET